MSEARVFSTGGHENRKGGGGGGRDLSSGPGGPCGEGGEQGLPPQPPKNRTTLTKCGSMIV